MDALLNVKPGLVFWTFVNFSLFLFIVIKFFGKPIINALKDREHGIEDAITKSQNQMAEATKTLNEAKARLDSSHLEVVELVGKAREQADIIIRKATEEADKIKKAKVEDAVREIERNKDAALIVLRKEVAELVVMATEKILNEKIDKNRDMKLIESYIENLPKN